MSKNKEDSLLYRLFLHSKQGKDSIAAQKAQREKDGLPPPPDENDRVLAKRDASERREPPTQEDAAPVVNPLQVLWEAFVATKDPTATLPDLTSLCERGEDGALCYEKDIENFREKIRSTAESRMALLEEEKLTPLVIYRLSKDMVTAWLFVFPPKGGETLTRELLDERLSAQSVNYGIDEEKLSALVRGELYFRIVPVAQGVRPVDGIPGYIVNLQKIDMHSKVKIDLDNPDVEIDWDNALNNTYPDNYAMVAAGDELCQIVKPIDGVDGISVKGGKVRYKPGRAAEIPKGPNVKLSEDGLTLVADRDGRVTFKNGKFVVENVAIIRGDVDISTGSLEFKGDILIKGDVREGFKVKATGDIIIEGSAENAIIIAGGNIEVRKGMNGNNEGIIEAAGDLRAKYLENCIVTVHGSIFVENIICCEINCDDSVFADQGKGVVVGGCCTVGKYLKAMRIGTESYRTTIIVVGGTTTMRQQCNELKKQADAAQEEFDQLERNLSYLERIAESLDKERLQQLMKMRLQKKILEMKASKLSAEYQAVHAQLEEVPDGRIQCGTIYPATKIVMGNLSVVIDEVHRGCNVYYKDGSIHMGHI